MDTKLRPKAVENVLDMNDRALGDRIALCVACLLLGVAIELAGCAGAGGGPPGPGGVIGSNGGGRPTGGGGASAGDVSSRSGVVTTWIRLDSIGGLGVGDDLIVFGVLQSGDEIGDLNVSASNQSPGIHYVFPSEVDGDTDDSYVVPNSDELYRHDQFVVSGKRIVLVNELDELTVFDTTSGQSFDIPGDDITLETFLVPHPLSPAANGYVATINDTKTVADGRALKVLDLNTTPPTVISFPDWVDPTNGLEVEDLKQVVIDPSDNRLAAIDAGWRAVFYDIENPSVPKYAIDLTGDGIDTDTLISFSNGRILYHQLPSGQLEPEAALLDVDAAKITEFDDGMSVDGSPVALANDSFGYFYHRVTADEGGGQNAYRTAIGRVEDAPSATLANQFDNVALREQNVYDTSQGCVEPDTQKIGYGGSMCVTPDGKRWFIAGWSGGVVDPYWDSLQTSTGGEFESIPDPHGETMTGSVMAINVVCSENVVAFTALRQTANNTCVPYDNMVLGFIRLEQFK